MEYELTQLNKSNSSGKKIQSLTRAMSILQCFYTDHDLSLAEISARVGLSKSTAHGLISTLVYGGFLQQDKRTNRYSIGIEVFRLGQTYSRDVSEVIRPYLQMLAEEFQETANYTILDGVDLVYIEKVESPKSSLRIATFRGQRRPLYCTAAGKAIMAYLPEPELAQILDSIVFRPITEKTICSRERLVLELMDIRKTSFAVDNEENELGVYCIASPVIDSSGLPIGAMSVSGPKVRVYGDRREQIISRLISYSRKVSQKF